MIICRGLYYPTDFLLVIIFTHMYIYIYNIYIHTYIHTYTSYTYIRTYIVHTMQCNAMQRNATQRNATQCNACQNLNLFASNPFTSVPCLAGPDLCLRSPLLAQMPNRRGPFCLCAICMAQQLRRALVAGKHRVFAGILRFASVHISFLETIELPSFELGVQP